MLLRIGKKLRRRSRFGRSARLRQGSGEAVFIPRRNENWWALRDSNPQPKDYESSALTVELKARFKSRNESGRRRRIPQLQSMPAIRDGRTGGRRCPTPLVLAHDTEAPDPRRGITPRGRGSGGRAAGRSSVRRAPAARCPRIPTGSCAGVRGAAGAGPDR